MAQAVKSREMGTCLGMFETLLESARLQDMFAHLGCYSVDDYRRLIEAARNDIALRPKLRQILELVEFHNFECQTCGISMDFVADRRLPLPWAEDLAVRMHAYLSDCRNPVLKKLAKPTENPGEG